MLTIAPGCLAYPAFSPARISADSSRRFARRPPIGAFLRPDHAADRQALFRPHDQSRAARLGIRPDGGYRYQPTHPVTGRAWPPIPDMVIEVWRTVSGYPHPPEACLVNYYAPGAQNGPPPGLRRERTSPPRSSRSRSATPACSASAERRVAGPTRSLKLSSGDVVVLGGASRLAFHGVDRIYPGTSTLLADWFPEGGRINLTLRRVSAPD